MGTQRCNAIKHGFSAKLRNGASAGLPPPMRWL